MLLFLQYFEKKIFEITLGLILISFHFIDFAWQISIFAKLFNPIFGERGGWREGGKEIGRYKRILYTPALYRYILQANIQNVPLMCFSFESHSGKLSSYQI